ncbi:MAG: 3-phosphoglycerate dehydrogenase [Bacteroidetes bacterium]|nr:3-phosphoglycerate dehydrogenase [Bacteroidota bacterium]
MNKIKILANDGMDAQCKVTLEQNGFEIEMQNVPQANLAQAINDNNYEVISVRSASTVRKELIDACPNLKVIVRGGVGMDNIDVEYARSKGLTVYNTPASSSHSVAELVFAHLFGMVRFVYQSNRDMPVSGDKEFGKLKKKYSGGKELKGKTIGIIGIGRIGQDVAKIALGCGMKVIAHDAFVPEVNLELDIDGINPKPVITIKTISLDELLMQSDFISVHVPGGNVIGAAEIAKMKPGVCIVNTARGGVIDEMELLKALDAKHITHAALDVFENEPTPKSELLHHPNISLTPHIGASTKEAQERIGDEIAQLVIAHFKSN